MMNRRQVLQSIVVASAGMIVYPACQPGTKEPVMPSYDNLVIDLDEFQMIQELSHALLPLDGVEAPTPEPVYEFILTMVNDCYQPAQAEKYVDGLKRFQEIILENYQVGFKELSAEQRKEFLDYLYQSSDRQSPVKFFFDTTLQLSKQHFTSSEYFLKEQLDWKFLPGEYKGCEPIS
ncbi:MAG: gluconate 2-dehydrogenase subunit 3 family protein [Bacteroidota bacterium]